MSTIALDRLPPEVRERPPLVLTMDNRRGTGGMWLFIATEGFLFLMFFVAYFYLAKGGWNWPGEKPPDVKLAIPMLADLLASSAVLHWGEKQVKERRYSRGQFAIGGTLLLAAGFLVLSFFDYKHHLKDLGPTTNAYGSIFYTITSFHLAHLFVGMLMLGYVLILPVREPSTVRPTGRACFPSRFSPACIPAESVVRRRGQRRSLGARGIFVANRDLAGVPERNRRLGPAFRDRRRLAARNHDTDQGYSFVT